MAKTKTSKRRKSFSFDEMPISKLKSGVKTVIHDPRVNLSNYDFIAKALVECLFTSDIKAFKEFFAKKAGR